MKHITLPGTDLSSSVLGFGCASLMARIQLPESVRILESAFDAGVTHFDVARSYGYGEAEKAVGTFAANKRDKISITTKFGILPPRRSTSLDVAKAIARKVVAVFPGMRTMLRNKAASLVSAGRFNVQDAKNSIETSLRELNTDYIDILMLHECSVSDLQSEELLNFLQILVKKGSIRYFGTATTFESTQNILQSNRPAYTSIIQFPSDPLNQNIQKLPPANSAKLIHSPLGQGLQQIYKYVTSSPAIASEWSKALGADCSNINSISRLMLGYALESNPLGIVLFSSVKEQNIRANTAAGDGGVTEEQLKNFSTLVAQNIASIKSVS